MPLLTIDNAFRIKYHDDLIMLAQQQESRLERTVRVDPDLLNGKMAYFDRMAATEDQEDLDRFGDTPNILNDHTRRRCILRDFIWAGMIDRKDERRLAASAQLPDKYRTNAVWAMNRRKDTLIIGAAFGNSFSVDANEAASAVALPSTQKVPVAASGLTLDKLLSVKEILDGNEVDEDEKRYFVYTSKQGTNLLNTTEIKSADYNTVKALVKGEINEFLNMEFIRTERLGLDGNGDRQCGAWTESAIGMCMGEDIVSDITRRADKKNNIQVQVDYSGDAVRVEEEKVVEVACQES